MSNDGDAQQAQRVIVNCRRCHGIIHTDRPDTYKIINGNYYCSENDCDVLMISGGCRGCG